jgi:Ser/Thr protein kinase RdoA (MazF antagonist)
MAKAAGFAWMPRLGPTIYGETLVNFQGQLWELTTWMPGQANFANAPSVARLESACLALALLHVEWAESETSVGVCPGVLRRWQSWRLWTDLLQSGWRPRWAALDPYAPIAELLFHAVQRHLDDAARLLTPWLSQPMTLQPCVCDPWHDHVLFTGDAVTGLIDFGSAKIDHVAVDLARLLGSLVGDDPHQWRIGISAYRRVRPFSDDEHRLARDLDRTGTLLAATHWLRWLYHEGRRYDQPVAVLDRLRHLAARIAFMSNAQGLPPLGFA